MRLKKGFILHDVGGEHMVVAVDDAAKDFNGLIRNNKTADFVFRKLLQDTSEEEIVKAMINQFAASEDVIARDVHMLLDQLRHAGFMEE